MYVQFSVSHPSHYRVMFGGFIESASQDQEFVGEAKSAFRVHVNAVVDEQNTGQIRRDDPVLMARLLWALVHGIPMFAIDGQLHEASQKEAVEEYAVEGLLASLAASA